MTAAEPRAEAKKQETANVSWLLWGSAIVGIAAGILFYTFPQLDIKTAALFYQGNGVFYGKGDGGIYYGQLTTSAAVIRAVLYFSFVAVCIGTAIGLLISIVLRRPFLTLSAVKWLFLGVCLAMGPGVVGNVMLKNHWGRARPVHIVEFGGSKSYSLPLSPSHQCDHNCSFVAGEASMMYATFFAASFLFPAFGRRLIIAGVFAGLFSGLIRMSQGAHFLSDVIFAGVAMALTVAGIYLLFALISRAIGARDNAPAENPLARWYSW